MPLTKTDFSPTPVDPIPEAVVTVGDIPIDDGSLYDIDDDGLWTDYFVVNRYEKDNHIYMMPMTSPNGFQGNQVAFVQLAAFTALLICDWKCQRVGEQPEMPHPAPQDTNAVLMDEHYEPVIMDLMGDGETKVWTIAGTFVYGFKTRHWFSRSTQGRRG